VTNEVHAVEFSLRNIDPCLSVSREGVANRCLVYSPIKAMSASCRSLNRASRRHSSPKQYGRSGVA
jgi:hypothetical protein